MYVQKVHLTSIESVSLVFCFQILLVDCMLMIITIYVPNCNHICACVQAKILSFCCLLCIDHTHATHVYMIDLSAFYTFRCLMIKCIFNACSILQVQVFLCYLEEAGLGVPRRKWHAAPTLDHMKASLDQESICTLSQIVIYGSKRHIYATACIQ